MGKLDLKEQNRQWIYLKDWNCYKLDRVVYCENPRAPQEQSMNIYVPAEYLNPDGIAQETESKNGYTARTAPVIFENGLAGYREAEPFELNDDRSMGVEAVLNGFVYVSCGCRGRSSRDENGVLCGKAPVSVADLKAGIRFLKKNASVLPGNMERIISVGISAGGAMSTLLGCTGDCRDYDQELKAMGADLTQSDSIFGAQCYCPITDLDHADLAYEWMFEGQTHYTGMPFLGFGEGNLTPFCQALSKEMGKKYVEYFNSLNLKHPKTGEILTIENGHGGNGSIYLKEQLEKSAEKYIVKTPDGKAKLSRYSWLSITENLVDNMKKSVNNTGKSVDNIKSLVSTNDSGEYKVTVSSLEDMEKDYHKRLKLCPAFDDLDLIQAENQEFGTEHTDKRHFNTEFAGILENLRKEFPEETANYLSGYQEICEDKELKRQKKLLNPLNYIGITEENLPDAGINNLTPHYRIRVGAKDADTSLTVTMILALKLMETKRTDVDYEIVWDERHGRADYPEEMVSWVKSICK